jgi:hypothetical protein
MDNVREIRAQGLLYDFPDKQAWTNKRRRDREAEVDVASPTRGVPLRMK